MIWTKGAHQSAKIQTFDCSRKISPNLYFDTLLIVYKILSKKYIRVISHGSEDWCKIWRKTYLFYKNDKNLVKFDLSTCKSPNLHFHLLLLCKVFNVWPRKVQRSYLSWHWRVMQIWRQTDLWFRKWHEEYAKFSPEHLKVSKLGF